MIEDVMADAVHSIDEYLSNGLYSKDATLLWWIIAVRNQMETLRAYLDIPPNWKDKPFARRLRLPTGTIGSPRGDLPPPADVLDALVQWRGYSAYDEERHYDDCVSSGDDVANHIWLSIKKVADWMNRLPGIEDARARDRARVLKQRDDEPG